MSSFFNRLLGKNAPAATPAATTTSALGDKGGKVQPTADVAEPQESFVCRQPMLDRKERISGYQFSLPEEVETRLQSDFAFLPKIYDDAVLRNLTSMGDDALLGSRQAFVRLSPDSLSNPRLHKLPIRNTVLMLALVHDTLDAESIQRQLEVLRQAGFAHGWLLRQAQLAQLPELLALAARADYVQIDAAELTGMDLKLLLKALHEMRPSGLPKPHLIAGGLNAFDEVNLYFRAGFEYFLGQFVTRRENWQPPKSNINQLHVFKLLNLLRSNAELELIANEFKHDPVLSFKLLRYINSPVMGLTRPVSGIDKALILLGRDKFYRWLSLMLFDFKTPGYKERVLTEQALSRAHFLESIAGEGTLPAQPDWLFMLGLFSTLDLLMGQTMAELLLQARLPDPLREALLGEPGPYGEALHLAIAAEAQSPKELQQYAAICGVPPLRVSRCAMQALAWANEISSLSAS